MAPQSKNPEEFFSNQSSLMRRLIPSYCGNPFAISIENRFSIIPFPCV